MGGARRSEDGRPPGTLTTGEIAERAGGRLEGDPDRRIRDVAPVERAGPDELTFVVDDRYARLLEEHAPGAVLLPPGLDVPPTDAILIRVEEPRVVFSRLVGLFRREPRPAEGVAPTAIVEAGAQLGPDVALGPYAVVEEDAVVGEGTCIGPHTVVSSGARVGSSCVIGGSCSILGFVRMGDGVRVLEGTRLGTDGFGYAAAEGDAVRVPQVGRLVIGDRVEIGANVTIDRGTLADTVIGSGTKIDNLVHVAHNVRIGENCMIVAQVGIAGSVEIGDGVQFGGQAGIAGHLSIGDGARIGAQAGVIGDVPAGQAYSGYPARPHRQSLRASAALLRLPALLSRIDELEATVAALRASEEEA